MKVILPYINDENQNQKVFTNYDDDTLLQKLEKQGELSNNECFRFETKEPKFSICNKNRIITL